MRSSPARSACRVRKGGHVIVQDGLQRVARGAAPERREAGKHFVEHTPKLKMSVR